MESYSFMENLIRLVEAMGFWGWIAVIACTAIIADRITDAKKARYKHYERLAQQEQENTPDSSNAQNDHSKAQVDISKRGIYVKDGDEEVNVSWKGVEVRDGQSSVSIPSWVPLGIFGVLAAFLGIIGFIVYVIL